MRNGKIRRFRPRTNRHHHSRRTNSVMNNNGVQQLNGHRNSFSTNNISKNPYNLEKIIEKYKNLAKEALSTGDKVLHENFLQHSDHFSRLLLEVNELRKKNTVSDKTTQEEPLKTDQE